MYDFKPVSKVKVKNRYYPEGIYMKKLIASLLAVCTITAFVSCGSSDNSSTVKLNNNDNIQGQNDEKTSALDGEAFEKLPDEAVDSFNFVADSVKELFVNDGGEWMYGYKGTGKINNSGCYIFAVYTYKDDIHTKLGTVAKDISSNDLFVLNEATGEYVKAELSEDNSHEAAWAETETLAFSKNS